MAINENEPNDLGELRQEVESEEARQARLRDKTRAFFGRDVDEITRDLQAGDGMEIVMTGTEPGEYRSVRVRKAEAWKKAGTTYQRRKNTNVGGVNMTDLPPATIWAFYRPYERMSQSLLPARGDGESGGCVRILAVDTYSETTGKHMPDTPRPREGTMAKHLGLDRDEVANLSFLDDTGRLFVVRGMTELPAPPEPTGIGPNPADDEFETLFTA